MEKPTKKRDCKLQEAKQTNGIESSPTELALDIFSRLSITSLMQSSDFPIRNQLCFAELSGTDDGVNAVVKKIKICFSASMPEFIVVGSCNGILCLRDSLYMDSIYIYNPFTNYYKELPKTMQFDDEIVICGFGYHPETKQYKVVKIVYYWIANIDHRGVRRIRTPHEKFKEVPRPDFSSTADGRKYFLASLRGCLCAVVYKYGLSRDLEIWIMKEYNVKESWVKEFKIGGNGEILIEYKVGKLALYDVKSGRYKVLTIKGMPNAKFHEVPRPDFSSPRSGGNYQLTSLKGCLSAVVYKYGLHMDVEIWVMKEYNVKES
ncbi:hypothetical protein AgCh_003110 [Apium graveolens]